MFLKIVAVLLIFLGEVFAIIAELLTSKRFAEAAQHPTILVPMFLLITLSGILLVTGYVLGYTHLKNIWIVAAISVGSILIIEPLLTWSLFHEVPTLGAWIGLTFGVLGTLAALFL